MVIVVAEDAKKLNNRKYLGVTQQILSLMIVVMIMKGRRITLKLLAPLLMLRKFSNMVVNKRLNVGPSEVRALPLGVAA